VSDAPGMPVLDASPGGVRVEHTVTSGTFSLDGGTWDVDNNVWVLGDDAECVVIDAPHDAGPILARVGDRRVVAVLCTHAHDDHVTVATALARATGAPAYLHPEDRMLWDRVHSTPPGADLTDGQTLGGR
jgi:glyoxylase-like metal-dependent hydrolase (beta-lactamase superfamily II)